MPRKNVLTGRSTCPDEPDWQPLRDLIHGLLDDFMYMFAVDLEDGTRLHAYKHYWTRRYLHLDSERRAFVYLWDESCPGRDGRYEEVNPAWILDLVLQGHSEVRGEESGATPPRLRS
jgi:hypothetical protein